jgi:hypothetical protein
MPLDLDALETSFDLVAPNGDALIGSFYVGLLATASGPLFAGTDLRRQEGMLLGAASQRPDGFRYAGHRPERWLVATSVATSRSSVTSISSTRLDDQAGPG